MASISSGVRPFTQWALNICLILVRSPLAIVRLVVAEWILSIESLAARTLAHVLKESHILARSYNGNIPGQC